MSLKNIFIRALANTAHGAVDSAQYKQQMGQAPPAGAPPGEPGSDCSPCKARGAIYEAQQRAGISSWYG